jgi:hypothetical protein
MTSAPEQHERQRAEQEPFEDVVDGAADGPWAEAAYKGSALKKVG